MSVQKQQDVDLFFNLCHCYKFKLYLNKVMTAVGMQKTEP